MKIRGYSSFREQIRQTKAHFSFRLSFLFILIIVLLGQLNFSQSLFAKDHSKRVEIVPNIDSAPGSIGTSLRGSHTELEDERVPPMTPEAIIDRYQRLFVVGEFLYNQSIMGALQYSLAIDKKEEEKKQRDAQKGLSLKKRLEGKVDWTHEALDSVSRPKGAQKRPLVSDFPSPLSQREVIETYYKVAVGHLQSKSESGKVTGEIEENSPTEWLLNEGKSSKVETSADRVLLNPSTEGKRRIKSISIEQAIALLVAEAPKIKAQRIAGFGKPQISAGADAQRGKKLFRGYCYQCHGADGQGTPEPYNNEGRGIGPYGATPPYLFVRLDAMTEAYAGGTTPEFAERAAFGLHVTIPDMTPASVLSHEDWASVQAYVAGFQDVSREETNH